jgi:hypothetical protein
LVTGLLNSPPNTTLQCLHLHNNRLGVSGAHHLAILLAFSYSFIELDVSHNELGDDGIHCLCSASHHLESNERLVETALTRLSLRHNQIHAEGAIAIAQYLQTDTMLTYLDLSDNVIGDAGAQFLAHAFQSNATLVELHLSRNDIACNGARVLAQSLLGNTSLQFLDLQGNGIGVLGALVLADVWCRQSCHLPTLVWKDNPVTALGTWRLQAAHQVRLDPDDWLGQRLYQIEHGASANNNIKASLRLHLNGPSLNDDTCLAILYRLSQVQPKLMTLSLQGQQLTARAMLGLTSHVLSETWAPLDSLELSHIPDLDLTGAGWLAQGLARNTSLRKVSLSYLPLTVESIRAVARGLARHPRIQYLYLRHNRSWGEDGIRTWITTLFALSLSESWEDAHQSLATSCSIQYLSLSDNALTDDALLGWHDTTVMTCLHELHLSDNPGLTDYAALTLSALVREPCTLRTLNVQSTGMTHRGLQTLLLYVPKDTTVLY